jgi:hypothetical protein
MLVVVSPELIRGGVLMARTNKAVCPYCGKGMKSEHGIRVGKQIHCPACGSPFTVQANGGDPLTVAESTQQRKINMGRLAIVLLGGILYLLGGATLALYCFSLSAHHAESTPAGPSQSAEREDDNDQPLPPSQPAATAQVRAEEQRKIDNAVARGVWYLKDHMLPAGTWGDTVPDGAAPVSVGFASLPALALLECGVPASDPVIQKAAALVRRQVDQLGDVHQNYQRSLAILFLDRLGKPGDESLIQHLALCLIAAQHPTEGAWSYNGPLLDRRKTSEYLRALRDKGKKLGDWRKTVLNGGDFNPGGWDNSNTQFVILALWVAQRHQISIDTSMALAVKHFRNTQLPSGQDSTRDNLNLDGSWYYNATNNSGRWPSMTCAGLLALAVAHAVTTDDRQKQQKPMDDPAIRRALDMLTREIDRPGEQRPLDLYFLWSLERVGVLYDLAKMGDKDWYTWGSKVLVSRQHNDGSWSDGAYYGSTPVLDTCFALLFLKQANLAKDLTTKLQLLEKK